MADDKILRCSRCRSKRADESQNDLKYYATCLKCRNRRKIKKPSVREAHLQHHFQQQQQQQQPLESQQHQSQNDPQVEWWFYDEFHKYLSALSLNQTKNLNDYTFQAFSDEKEFPRYEVDAINAMKDVNSFYTSVCKKLVHTYMRPISEVTGYKFPTRDCHKGGSKTKKITMMFICAQDKTKQRKSRSKDKRSVSNKLKIYNCFGKINLSYDIVEGAITIKFSHNSHDKLQPWSHDLKNIQNDGQAIVDNEIQDLESSLVSVEKEDRLGDNPGIISSNISMQSIAAAATVVESNMQIDETLVKRPGNP